MVENIFFNIIKIKGFKMALRVEKYNIVGEIDNIQEKFPNFAIRLTEHNTNPINYLI